MKVSTWIKTPPQVHGKLVRLKYKNIDDNKVRVGLFSWSNTERTFVGADDRTDLAIYVEDGWRIVAWQEYKER